MRYRDHGAFMPSSRFEAIIFLAKVTILHAGGGDGRLDQSRAQVRIAGSNVALAPFPRALVLTRAETGPGSQMADCRPLAHLDANLGNDDAGRHPIDAGDPIKQLHLTSVWFELGLEFRVHLLEVSVKPIKSIELHREQLTVVIFHAPIERQP